MFGTGILAGLIANVAGLGSVAKVAVATTTVALTVTVAGATAVVLPSDNGHSAAAINEGVIRQAASVVDLVTSTASGETPVQAGGEASVATPTTLASATANAGGTAQGVASLPIPSVPVPSVPNPAAALPDLSTLAQIPTQVMNCLAPILNLVTGLPPSPAQISQIGPTIVGCVSGIVQGLPLPFGLNACISEIFRFVGVVTSQVPTGIPSAGGLNVAACIPSGLPVPTGFPGGSSFTGGGFPFGAGGGFGFGK